MTSFYMQHVGLKMAKVKATDKWYYSQEAFEKVIYLTSYLPLNNVIHANIHA